MWCRQLRKWQTRLLQSQCQGSWVSRVGSQLTRLLQSQCQRSWVSRVGSQLQQFFRECPCFLNDGFTVPVWTSSSLECFIQLNEDWHSVYFTWRPLPPWWAGTALCEILLFLYRGLLMLYCTLFVSCIKTNVKCTCSAQQLLEKISLLFVIGRAYLCH